MVRALRLPPDERRAALMAATEPLLSQFGREVSTRQIAEAAGVAEGTIFRAFPTKEALIDAVIEDAFDVQQTCDQLAALDPDLAFEPRVTAAVEILQARLRRIIALFHALRLAAPTPQQATELQSRRRLDHELLTAAFAEVLEPYADRLRRPPAEVAEALQTVTFSLTHPMLGHGHLSTPAQIVDLVLHGLAVPACQEPSC